MTWYHYVSLSACLIGCGSLLLAFIRLVRAGKPKEFSRPAGKVTPAVRYSFTGAMNPAKKESAYQHLPTYTAGILYHLGTFLSILIWIISWFAEFQQSWITWGIASFLLLSFCCGLGILGKRILYPELRSLSNPDDYVSNILVTLFQAISGVYILAPSVELIYYILSAILLICLPVGKLKHALYFFAARYHLGFFFGWRGVWPPKPSESE